jgi:hypothetical protein
MTSENAIEWLETEQFNQWMLFRGDDEKVSSFEGEESIQESIERFSKIVKLQMPGKYNLKAYKGKSKQASASSFRFDIKPEVHAPGSRTQSSGSGFNAQEMYDRAEQSAYNKFLLDRWRKDVDQNFDTLFKEIEGIKKSILELNDEYEDNDDNAMERISNVAQQVPGIAKGLEGLKGMFR